MFQVEVFTKLTLLFYVLNESKIVRSDIHLKLRRLLTCGVESRLELGIKLFQITAAFLVEDARQGGILSEIVFRDEGNAEKLVTESNPIKFLFYRFAFISRLTHVVGIVLYLLIEDRGVAILKRETLLMLATMVGPFYLHLFIRGGESVGKALHLQGET